MTAMAAIAPPCTLTRLPCSNAKGLSLPTRRVCATSTQSSFLARRLSKSHAAASSSFHKRKNSCPGVCFASVSSPIQDGKSEMSRDAITFPNPTILSLMAVTACNLGGRLLGNFLAVAGAPILASLAAARAASLVSVGSSEIAVALGGLCLAAVRQPGPVSTPLTVVASGMAKWLELYSGVLLIRVLLSWFPNIDWERQPLQAMRDMCDPYLNLFRNILPPFFGALDLSPMLAFLVLGLLSSILNTTMYA